MLQSGVGGGGGVGVHDIDTVLSPSLVIKLLSITPLHDLKDYKCGKIDKTLKEKKIKINSIQWLQVMHTNLVLYTSVTRRISRPSVG